MKHQRCLIMKFKCLGSGSSGNCYIIEKNGRKLILDCGVMKKDILVGIDFDISTVDGCLVSHSHSDHKRSLRELRNMCINCFAPYETKHNTQILTTQLGIFKIYAFPLPHNGVTNYGFLVECEGEKLLYMTDFEYCDYYFKSENINHLIIECNYRDELIDKSLPNFEHKVLGHCEFEVCKRIILKNYTDSLRSVILAHLGECVGKEEDLINDIKKDLKSDILVTVAKRGVELG